MAAVMSGHVSDFVLGHDDSKSEDIAKDVYEKKVTLVQLVESLGEHLTNPDVSTRKRGTQLLVDVLQKQPTDLLSEKEVGHVATFLVSRLGDHHSIQPHAVRGLAAVTSFMSFPGGELSRQICSEIFKEIQNQTMAQGDRRYVYTTFLNLLTSYLTDLQPMGDNFVCGYIQQMDGEKDPRNLMLAFRCSVVICNHLKLGAMEEDMFEVNACYFPVDFVPPPNDPHGITRDDLSESLRHVLASTPVFAPYCYPLLLEKLSSDVQSAKLQALAALCECLPVYQMNQLQEFLGSFSFQLMREVRNNSSDELVAASLQALTALITQLSQELGKLDDYMAETLPDLIRQVESDSAAVRLTAMRLLRAMASASPAACCTVTAKALPALCNTCLKLEQSQLEHQTDFLTDAVSFLQTVSDDQEADLGWNFLAEWRGKTQELCDKLLASKVPQLQVLGMRGLCALSTWFSFLPSEGVVRTLEKIVSKAIGTSSENVRKESEVGLSKVLKKQLSLADVIIPSLTDGLLANQGKYSSTEGRQALDNSTALLASVAVSTETAERVCSVLLQSLHLNNAVQVDCLLPVSSSLAKVLQSCHLSAAYLLEDVVPSLLAFLSTDCQAWPRDKQQLHAEVLTQLTDGLRSAVLQQDKQVRMDIVHLVCGLVISGDPSLPSAGGDSSQGTSPLQAFSTWQQSRLIQLLLAVTPCLDTQNDPWVGQLLASLPEVAVQASDVHSRLQACKCVAAIINKMPTGELLNSLVNNLSAKIIASLEQSPSSDLEKCHMTLTLLTWLVKALVVRGHKAATGLTTKLTALLADSKLGLKAAEGFQTILAPYPDVLNVAVHANVTPTFQQRFLVQNLPSLVSGFHSATLGLKEPYLLAVAGMLTNVPKQVLVTELPQLMPLLVSALNGDNSDLHRQALSTLTAGIKHSPEVLTAYLSDILPDCLHLSASAPSMQERILALKFVGETLQLPLTALQPHKSLVLKSLKPVLDDRKRLVRKEAVAARSAWFLL